MVTSARLELTPQMAQYDDFVDRSETRWLPYLMYFHRSAYRSAVVNTDRLGFRYSHGPEARAALADQPQREPVNLLVGTSTAFGVGAESDAGTISSRLWSAHAPARPWLNFGGRGFSSTQEVLLFLLNRHLLPPVREIVVLSGLNNLALAGLPQYLQTDYGAFFFAGEYQAQMDELRTRHRQSSAKRGSRLTKRWRESATPPVERDSSTPDLDDRLANAVAQTSRDLENWQMFAAASDARVSFVLQPLASWVREQPCEQEQAIFAELDAKQSNFWKLFGDIMPQNVGCRYAEQLAAECDKKGIAFFDLNPALASTIDSQDWLFVDRAHFHDAGYDLVSRLISAALNLA
jgi:hypothetical protein